MGGGWRLPNVIVKIDGLVARLVFRETSTRAQLPEPLTYHRAIVRHLQALEPKLWTWFASARKDNAEADAVRLDLLKSTYRLEQESQPELYEIVNRVRRCMQLNCVVTLYQAQPSNALDASLAYLPGEAHICSGWASGEHAFPSRSASSAGP